MNGKRTLSFILASLLMLPTLAACSESATNTPETTDTAAVVDTTAPIETEPRETERHEIKDTLPDNLNYDGTTWRIYVSGQGNHDDYVMGLEEREGDIVNDAVFDRNLNVQERLNFVLEANAFNDSYQDNHTKMSALITAGDDTYDLFLGQEICAARLVPQKLFVNAYDLEHIDFSQPWWMNNYMDELTLNKDYRYLLASDFNTHAISFIRCNYFNKKLYNDLYGDPDELYKEVLDGKWTLDHMNELTQGAYKDLNGDGVKDMTDQFGMYCHQLNSTVDGFVYGSDVQFTRRDSSGFIEITMKDNEGAVQLLEDLIAFFHSPAVYVDQNGNHKSSFQNGTTLFITDMFTAAKDLREMEEDFGFLPFPKTSEEQETYKTLVHDTAQLSCIPVSSSNIAISGAILEALSAESYRLVTPAYYESALKLKYARDDISSQVIDLLRDSMTTNFIYAYYPLLNDIGVLYRTLVQGGSNTYASYMRKMAPALDKKLADIVAKFNEG